MTVGLHGIGPAAVPSRTRLSSLAASERGDAMGFIQIVEFTTDDYDKVREIDDKWVAATEGKRTARRQIVGRDRNNPDRYLAIVFFDSFESAMQNSALPETQQFAGQYSGVTKSVAFHDLDVISDQEV
jgi:hypothetical protein